MNIWKKATGSDRFLLGGAILCLALSLMLLGVKGSQLRAAEAADDQEFLRFVDVAAEIYNDVRGKYVDEVKGRDVLEGALAGMFSRLDEHSQYMDPSMLDGLNKDTGGQFSGIGIHITMRQGLLTVIAPIPGSPSAKIGLAPWDRIVEIEGKTTEGMTLQQAVEKLTGPTGTQVTIKIFREGEAEPLEFAITRASIKINSVYYKMHDAEAGIGYLRIARFSENTAADMRKGLLDLRSQGMKGLMLDLRYNSGGLLREAIEVSNLFTPKHAIIVSTKGRLRSQNQEYRATEEPLIQGIPVFVLVNEGSASASEIVAGALQDLHLGVVIGPKGKNTFGKGSVQTIESLRNTMYDDEDGNPKESAIRLTTARYYTPSGRTIHHVGVTPDIGVPVTRQSERDLLRSGLYGDTTIPLTVEEQKAEEEAERRATAPEEVDGTIEVHTPQATPAEEAPAPDVNASGDPFYTKAKRPELAETGEFLDVLLDEATKQMKIYMILDGARGGTPTVASAESEPATSVAK